MDSPNSVHDAILLHQADHAHRLLQEGEDPNALDEDGNPALWTAAITGQADVARLLLNFGAVVDMPESKYGMTPLMGACKRGGFPVVQVLLKGGADPNSRDKSGETPLMFACKSGETETVKALLAVGAEPGAKDEKKRTALHVAVERGDFPEVVHLLLSRGLDPQASDSHGNTPLAEAERRNFVKATEAMRSRKPNT